MQIVAGNKINASPVTVVQFGDNGLAASTAYYYKVTAVNAAGESVGSVEVTASTAAAAATTPAMPTGVSATAASSTQINLAWTAVANVTSYNIYRGTAAGVVVGTASKINTNTVTTASFNDTGLTAATAYYYKVAAVNAAGESVGSAEVSATTQAVGGATPTITSFTPSSGAAGTTVTITGTNFSTTPASNTVNFNGVAASVTSATATQLVVTVPGAVTTEGSIGSYSTDPPLPIEASCMWRMRLSAKFASFSHSNCGVL